MTRKDYPSTSTFKDVGWADSLSLYAEGLWVQLYSVVDTDLIRKYVDEEDWLPVNIPLVLTENSV